MNESDINKSKQVDTNNSSNEIDIFEVGSRVINFIATLFGAIKKLIVNILSLVLSIIIFVIRRWLWIGAFGAVGVIMGIMYNLVMKPYYTSTLEGTSGGVDNSVVINHINTLFYMKNDTVRAHYLNLSVDNAKKIRNIKAAYGMDINFDGKTDYIDWYDGYKVKDTTQSRVPSLFYVRVELYDESIMQIFRDNLFKYINSNVYIQNLYEIDKRQKKEYIVEIEKSIVKIDTAQLVSINKNRGRKEAKIELGQNLFVLGNDPEIKLYYPEILSLYTQKQGLERSIEISDKPVVIIQDFTPSKYIEKQLLYYVIRLGGVMAFLGLICGTLWHYREPLLNAVKEEETIRIPKF